MQLVRPTPPSALWRDHGRQISPVPLDGFVTVPVHTRTGAVRRAAIRSRARAELGPQDVSTCAPTQLPRGLWLLLRRLERSRVSRRDDPAKRPRPSQARERNGNTAAGSERARQSPLNLLYRAVRKTASPYCKANAVSHRASQRSGLKRFAESTAGIIPGDRGKAGGSWCHPPL